MHMETKALRMQQYREVILERLGERVENPPVLIRSWLGLHFTHFEHKRLEDKPIGVAVHSLEGEFNEVVQALAKEGKLTHADHLASNSLGDPDFEVFILPGRVSDYGFGWSSSLPKPAPQLRLV